uniref:Leucine rich repeat containing 20 n=1 Tax=Chelonoidis abingdonii TaxID=106734 RepID=A0A8C0HCP4_CHEAB
MEKKMGEAVARVARKVNETVENGADSLDLADCKLMMFPIGIYKVMRNITEGIHLITLANNELKSVTSKFITTFSQMRVHHFSLPPTMISRFPLNPASAALFILPEPLSILQKGALTITVYPLLSLFHVPNEHFP